MRISEDMIYNLMNGYLANGKENIYNIQEKVSSGKKVSRPSDDPGAYEIIRRLRDSEACLTQKSENSDHLRLDLTTVDGVLQGVTDILHRASELVIDGSDGTKTPDDRTTMGSEVNMLLNQLVDLANTNYGGRYIFSGLRTDAPAYGVTKDAAGLITSVTYQGNTGVRDVEIGKYNPGSDSNRVEANIPGSDTTGQYAVFQTNMQDMFKNLIRLRDRLTNGDNLVESESFTADSVTDSLAVGRVYETGERVFLSSEGTYPGGLNPNTTYYAIYVSDTEIQLATSYENAIAGTAVDITANGNGVIDRQHLAELNFSLEHLLSMRAEVGARLQRLDLNDSYITQQKESITSGLQTEEDIDVAQAMLELTKQQTSYEAALKVIAGTMKMSLVDYL